ncbi:MAG: DUF3108 domain-containing protein, partial [Pseudomonadota bacterium]
NYASDFDGRRYSIDADAKAKLLLGALRWNGDISAQGRMVDGRPRPASFTQEFQSKRKLLTKTKRKKKTASMQFRDGTVADTQLEPPRKTNNRAPLKPEHTRDVLDPASAVIALTMPRDGDSPCAERLKVYDGRMRFDLRLAFKRNETLQGVSGPGKKAVVCSVRYVPIGGHKLNDKGNERLQKGDAIEVAFRPIADGDFFVPHEVRVKTGYGAARLTARRVEIDLGGGERIALTN